jgi:hypothetical protein
MRGHSHGTANGKASVVAPTQADFKSHRLLLKENEADARERLRAFWAGSSLGRPALMVTVKGGPIPPLPAEEERFPDHKARQWDPQYIGECTNCVLTYTTDLWLAESMPRVAGGMASCLGLPALLIGADYHDDPSRGTSWIEPMPGLYERPLPTFDLQAPRIAQFLRLAQAHVDNTKHRAFVNPPILLDAMTTLSLLRTPEQFCLDLVDRPDDVHRWRDALDELSIGLYEGMYQILLANGYGEAGSFFSLMAEGRMEAVQCDFAVMLSPAQFERFVMPYLRRMTDYLDYSLYHLDGTCQMRFLDQLRTLPKLNGIQWNPEPPAGPPTLWLDALREIRKRNFALMVSCDNLGIAVAVTEALGPDGLALSFPAFNTRDEAEQAIQRIQGVC